MRTCKKCGAQIPEGQKFCGNCGAMVEIEQSNNPAQNQMNMGMGQVNNQRPASANNNSKTLIIVLASVFGVLIITMIIYFVVAMNKQNTLDNECLKEEIMISKGVVLNDYNKASYENVKMGKNSINIFTLNNNLDEIKRIIDVSNEYSKYNESKKGYTTKEGELSNQAKMAGIDLNKFASYVALKEKMKSLDDALAQNDSTKMQISAKDVEDKLEEYEKAILNNSTQSIGSEKELMNQYQKRYDNTVNTSKSKKINKKSKIIKAKNKASIALASYKNAVNSENLSNVASLKNDLETKLSSYESIVNKTKAANKKTKISVSNSGGRVKNINKAPYYEFAISDSDVYTINTDPFYYDTALDDVDRYGLCIIARNEIYARYGAHFKTASLRAYFKSLSWYTDTGKSTAQVEGMLSSVEKENVRSILAWQNNYASYVIGDSGKARDFSAVEYKNMLLKYYRR